MVLRPSGRRSADRPARRIIPGGARGHNRGNCPIMAGNRGRPLPLTMTLRAGGSASWPARGGCWRSEGGLGGPGRTRASRGRRGRMGRRPGCWRTGGRTCQQAHLAEVFPLAQGGQSDLPSASKTSTWPSGDEVHLLARLADPDDVLAGLVEPGLEHHRQLVQADRVGRLEQGDSREDLAVDDLHPVPAAPLHQVEGGGRAPRAGGVGSSGRPSAGRPRCRASAARSARRSRPGRSGRTRSRRRSCSCRAGPRSRSPGPPRRPRCS